MPLNEVTSKLLWLTDLHLVADDRGLMGYDPDRRLQCAVDYINTHHSDADYLVLSGDLANEGDRASYELLARRMADCAVPYLALPGNHDRRREMRQCLEFPRDMDGAFIQHQVRIGGYRVLLLDTLDPGNPGGILCARRLDWLDQHLDEDPSIPTVVFCHHHPSRLHLPMQDEEMLANGDALLQRLQAAGNVRHLFFGHVHRPVSGTFGSLGFSALQSATLQAPLPYPYWDWDSFAPADESPALGIAHLGPDSVVVHFHPFCHPGQYLVPPAC